MTACDMHHYYKYTKITKFTGADQLTHLCREKCIRDVNIEIYGVSLVTAFYLYFMIYTYRLAAKKYATQTAYQ